ncbi:arylamine N-acetyltransferase [Marinomonas sp.]|nr:arylamine N-acetyltransferase [Marinomonas sp.]MDB4837314.1 arylamine N-acetyltransferase [Marinomonas sp.]
MSLPPRLQHYVNDLGLVISGQPDMEFVTSLQAKHIEKYSFNSLAVVMGEDISLDLDDISEKIVGRGLGGYCFEHNKLTFELLKSAGYDVTLTMARVLNNQDNDVPRTHRVTLLTLDGVVYLIDTGFGGHGPIAPLALQPDLSQKAGEDVYRIVDTGQGEYDLQIIQDGDYFTLYRFDSAVYTDADCTIGNFYSHQYPKASFVNNLIVSLKSAQRTVALKNHIFTVKRRDDVQDKVLTSAVELHQVLTDVFEFDIALVAAEHLFERFLAKKIETLKQDAKSEKATS